MSLFAYSYGEINDFNEVLDDANATTLVSVGANDQEITVIGFTAGLASGASETTVRFDKYDGTTAYPILNWITMQADEVYASFNQIGPVHLGKGWSLRATRSAASNVYITGVYVQATNRG